LSTSATKSTGPKFPTSIRVKCTDEFKRDLETLAVSWTERKGQDYDVSKIVRIVMSREVARERRLQKKRRKRGQA